MTPQLRRLLAIALFGLAATVPELATACPGCSKLSEQVATAEPETVMAGIAFSWSVVFMLLFVFSIIGAFAAYVIKTVRQLDNERDSW